MTGGGENVDSQEVLELFRKTGVLLEGHFKLTSGRHSPMFLQCSQVMQYPREAARLAAELAARLEGLGAQAVIGPAMGGIILAYEVARVLGLGYPGGPAIDALAVRGEPSALEFPRAYLGEDSRFDFSFSGLKSAVINYIHNQRQRQEPENLPDLAASFQAAVVEVLVEKTIRAAREKEASTLLLGGGVASNSALRREMKRRLGEELPGTRLIYPPAELCTDNAAMVAAAAYPKFLIRSFAPPALNAIPHLEL